MTMNKSWNGIELPWDLWLLFLNLQLLSLVFSRSASLQSKNVVNNMTSLALKGGKIEYYGSSPCQSDIFMLISASNKLLHYVFGNSLPFLICYFHLHVHWLSVFLFG